MAHEPSPAEEARLRRLLARSRHDERLPDDVVTRLDGVLARLESGDPLDVAPAAEVHDLAAGRRRKVVSLLVAAAAVVVVGVGLGQVVDGFGSVGGSDTASEADAPEAADSAEGRFDSEDRDGPGEAGGTSQFSTESDSALAYDGLAAQRALGDLLVVDGRLTVVPEEGFTRAALRVQRRLDGGVATSGDGTDASAPLLSRAAPRVRRAWQGCAPVDWGDGVAVAVLYEQDPAVLVFRPANGDSQVVELLQCGTGTALRSVTLPAR